MEARLAALSPTPCGRRPAPTPRSRGALTDACCATWRAHARASDPRDRSAYADVVSAADAALDATTGPRADPRLTPRATAAPCLAQAAGATRVTLTPPGGAVAPLAALGGPRSASNPASGVFATAASVTCNTLRKPHPLLAGETGNRGRICAPLFSGSLAYLRGGANTEI